MPFNNNLSVSIALLNQSCIVQLILRLNFVFTYFVFGKISFPLVTDLKEIKIE
jgi:hypothetical protein